ncbi:BrnT family toxin [Acidicapsa acidisoli]|uniref:BrnT family toxin n=1 Tax=Acidicapsa acidisoli TaxID=1615681 RepID=UPI0021E02589|nr:BrnT family toxin [Acidicapsa acidisoli]
MFIWDEAKRLSNLKKHGLDFRDAHLIYDNPDKCTYDASREDEYRLMDVALAVLRGRLLTLVYMEIEDDVRVISFRNASREERKAYEEDRREAESGQ